MRIPFFVADDILTAVEQAAIPSWIGDHILEPGKEGRTMGPPRTSRRTASARAQAQLSAANYGQIRTRAEQAIAQDTARYVNGRRQARDMRRQEFEIWWQEILAQTTISGTAGPATTPGQAAGTGLHDLLEFLAVYQSRVADPIRNAFVLRGAWQEFLHSVAPRLPLDTAPHLHTTAAPRSSGTMGTRQQLVSHPIEYRVYGASLRDAEYYAVVVIGTQAAAVERLATQCSSILAYMGEDVELTRVLRAELRMQRTPRIEVPGGGLP